VAQTPLSLRRGSVPAPVVHPDRGGGAAARPAYRTAPGQARIRDCRQQPIGRRCRRRVWGVIAAAAHWLPEPEPAAVLGIDETRFRSVRWILDGITWRRSDPWMTSFVDCIPGQRGPLLGLAPSRTVGCVREWLSEQSDAFRQRIEMVVTDPSAPYASGIRAGCQR
jgi:hypothetical protein